MLSTFIAAFSFLPILALNTQLPIWSDNEQLLASHEMSLGDRYPNKSVDGVFKDNILLNLAYMDGSVKSASDVNWDKIRQPVTFQYQLKPGQTFAFHDGFLSQYDGKVTMTSAAHFNSSEGFKSDGYLVGDGVCHLASLMTWTAKNAGLQTLAPTNHDFANIPEVPREFGTAIYYSPGQDWSNAKQNLYITNNLNKPVTFKFEYSSDDKLKFSILEEN